jgi:hypothetical protein
MILIRLFVIIVTLLLGGGQALAARDIDLPFYESFDTDSYETDLVWVGGGASQVHQPTGGWSGGAARFFPPTTGQNVAGIGQLTGLTDDNADQINIRFLVRHGSSYIANFRGAKFIIVVRDPNDAYHNRPMVFDDVESDGTRNVLSYAPCLGTLCKYDNDAYCGQWMTGDESFTLYPGNYFGEWISIESEFNRTTGIHKLYITTQDGNHQGLYLTYDPNADGCEFPDLPQTGGTFNYIDVIGGFYNNGGTNDANTYFELDELVVDDSYIGPPDGFIGSTPPPPPAGSGLYNGRVIFNGNLIRMVDSQGE